MVVLSHLCVFEGDTNAHMLESDALPLCYRAVLYGVYRYVSFIPLSIPLYWGSLWVWSVRGEISVRTRCTSSSSDVFICIHSFTHDYYLAS